MWNWDDLRTSMFRLWDHLGTLVQAFRSYRASRMSPVQRNKTSTQASQRPRQALELGQVASCSLIRYSPFNWNRRDEGLVWYFPKKKSSVSILAPCDIGGPGNWVNMAMVRLPYLKFGLPRGYGHTKCVIRTKQAIRLLNKDGPKSVLSGGLNQV